MIKVDSCSFNNEQLCVEIFRIRTTVFVDEQRVSREEEFDEFETSSIHYLGSVDETPAGTARWRITKDGFKLERFAVLPEFRKKGVASAILQKVMSDVLPTGTKIYLNAQVSAIGFYEKYGFKK